MDSLRRINQEDGITVICNLHLLQTAKDYCDRIIGMRKGEIVFDGAPGQLTAAVARDIYGTELGDSEAIEEERHAALPRFFLVLVACYGPRRRPRSGRKNTRWSNTA